MDDQSTADTAGTFVKIDVRRVAKPGELAYWRAAFAAMGGPCEVLIDGPASEAEAMRCAEIVAGEVWRIERKYSRYRDDSVVAAINGAQGRVTEVDDETAQLLNYAGTCYEISDGLFDITSGILRRIWSFKPESPVPERAKIEKLLPLIGWEQCTWEAPCLSLKPGMELDLGGIAKEYAADRAASLSARTLPHSFVVNLGGDLFIRGLRANGTCWKIGIDDPGRTGERVLGAIEVETGGIATSGDARRFVLHHGQRLGHILNPKTGWPVTDAPRAVTVCAPSCIEAGTLATVAILRGRQARKFLRGQGVRFWVQE